MTTKTQEAALKFILKDDPNFDKTSLLHMKLVEEARSADGAKRAIIRATEKLSAEVQGQMNTLTKYSGFNGDYFVSRSKELIEEIARQNTTHTNSASNLRSLIHITMGLDAVQKFGNFLKNV